jgi:chemotaxis protein CheD
MGEWVMSATPDDVLVSIGLGSCVGLAVLEPGQRAALAHIMLPEAPESWDGTGGEAKYADRAVPLVLEQLARAGSVPSRLRAALVGGARMFTLAGGSGLDIGARNVEAVRTALESAGVRVVATEIGGTQGRTMRVHVGGGRVTVKRAGGREAALMEGVA